MDEPPGTNETNDAGVRADPGCLEETPPPPPAGQHLSESEINLDELADLARLSDIKLAMDFIRALEVASLDDEHNRLSEDAVERLRNPPTSPVDVSDPDFRLALDLFLAHLQSSQESYTLTREAILRRHPDDNIPSYDQMKRRIAEVTGVVPIIHHMCPNSCLAFTGPFAKDEACRECGHSRFKDQTQTTPTQEFYTIPIGPQLQALWANGESARNLSYRRRKTEEILRERETNGGVVPFSEDFIHGSDYLERVTAGDIQETDMVLMLSLDGAQLYAHRASDCWISIWVIFDHAPDARYKKKCVLPGSFIPGPNKPKIVDSFLFVGLHHLSALQREGLRIWDASRDITFISKPFLALATADGPGMTYLNGLVGHHGKNGCRLYCSIRGRRHPEGSHYYPALLKPHDFAVEGCDHDDVPYTNLPSCSKDNYIENLRYLMASPNETEYRKRRLATGISKPSIFLGLPSERILGIPGCFGSDIMHLAALNIPDLLIKLWRGKFDCIQPDNRSTWEWATLKGRTWEEHGRQVAATTPYLPGSFDRPPRNPAKKISSGYKAWEFLLYLYGVGPGLFYNILPQKYYYNYCKLVFGMRFIHQTRIDVAVLAKAHEALLEFACEFEVLYYQRRTERLHFVRQSVHAVTHLAPEVLRLGPPGCSSQWTMERTIGNLGQEIRQPSNPYANLSQRGLLRSQTNALIAMIPDLETPRPLVPRGACDLGNGYILLRAKDTACRPMRDCERGAFAAYLRCNHNFSVATDWSPDVIRWARLRIPNGQVARSAWKECLKPLEKVRMARNVKVSIISNILAL